MSSSNQSILKAATDSWFKHVSRVNEIFITRSDEQLAEAIAPGRNSGLYLLGHLTAVHDLMLPLLRLGDQLHPELMDAFVKEPDGNNLPKPSMDELREYWKEVSAKLNEGIASLSFDQWMERHNSISPEDFVKEPHRNRFSVLLSRTTHLAEHLGQLLWVKK